MEITGKGYCHWRTGSGSNTRRFTGNETYLEEKIFFVGTPDGKFSITVVKVQSKCTCSFVSYRQRSDDRAGRVWLWFQLSATSWAANIIRSTIRLDSIWSACGARYCLVARYRIQRVIYRHQTVQFELWWSIAGKNFTNQVVDSSTKAFDTSYSAFFSSCQRRRKLKNYFCPVFCCVAGYPIRCMWLFVSPSLATRLARALMFKLMSTIKAINERNFSLNWIR